MPSYEPVKGDEAIGSSRSSKSKYLRVAVIGIVATLGIFMLTSINSSNEAELGHKHKSAPEPTAAPTIEDSLGFCCFYGGCDDCKAKANGFCGQSPENCATCTGSYCSNPTAAPTIFVPDPTTSPVASPTAAADPVASPSMAPVAPPTDAAPDADAEVPP